ncbi:hypothetical protein [Saccharolobus islandicus]|uniref:hypothetical protein n=1 Tax=Saccharolobus islandicus TaxID=43080 RepID=UPI0003770170|nr:hypothetical protein [Sulfolobus islandicus]
MYYRGKVEQLLNKIELVIPYDKVRDVAVKYISSFPKSILENQRLFYEKVYVPLRDHFIEKVVNRKRVWRISFISNNALYLKLVRD